jgi:negative regulator of flagellin synthesis FlgM
MSYANGITGQQQTVSSTNSSSAPSTLQATTSAASTHESEASSNPKVEHADLTSLSTTGGLVAQALEGSDTRSAKVASLQQAIVSGNYNISSSDVAEKIMQSLLE